jgi:hypothetical protein
MKAIGKGLDHTRQNIPGNEDDEVLRHWQDSRHHIPVRSVLVMLTSQIYSLKHQAR